MHNDSVTSVLSDLATHKDMRSESGRVHSDEDFKVYMG
jgi:hypothetical protein